MGGFSEDGTGYNETDTSKKAAEAEKVLLRERIYRILFEAGPDGLADFELKELAAPYEFPGQRRSDLSRQERVRDTGKRRLNPEYRRRQIVWSAFDENGKVLREDPPARKRNLKPPAK